MDTTCHRGQLQGDQHDHHRFVRTPSVPIRPRRRCGCAAVHWPGCLSRLDRRDVGTCRCCPVPRRGPGIEGGRAINGASRGERRHRCWRGQSLHPADPGRGSLRGRQALTAGVENVPLGMCTYASSDFAAGVDLTVGSWDSARASSLASLTSWPWRRTWAASVRSASVSGRMAVTSIVRPSSSSTCTSSLRRDRSNPAYNMTWASWCWLLLTTPRLSPARPSSWHSMDRWEREVFVGVRS